MEASDLVHEESSYVAKQLALAGEPDGKNVIWDITMSSRESTEKRIDDLRSAGYTRIEGIFVDIPVDVGRRPGRTPGTERATTTIGPGNGLGGRFVPDDVTAAQADPDWGSSNRRTFEEVKPSSTPGCRCDNSVDGRAP